MKMLEGEKIRLRAMEPADLDLLYRWENDPEVWTISNTQTPFSKFILQKFIESSPKDIYTEKQLRLMIEDRNTFKTIGIIDLFDFDPFHQRIGVGILISEKERGKGFAREAIRLVKSYVFGILQLHQIYCNIMDDNRISMELFTSEGFVVAGNKRQWIRTAEGFHDEFFLQCFRNNGEHK